MKFILNYRTELSIFLLVPIHALRWYRLERWGGTDSSATLVPIHALWWYRFADTITVIFGEHPATMGVSPCLRMIFPSVVFSASLPSFFFSPPFFVSFISLLSVYPVERMCLFPRLGIFSYFPDCLHFNPVRIFSSSLHLFFLPASTLFLPGTPLFRFFPPAFPLPFPCAYI